jgi:hypothetical protein
MPHSQAISGSFRRVKFLPRDKVRRLERNCRQNAADFAKIPIVSPHAISMPAPDDPKKTSQKRIE